eukprot:scaffold234_cov406-Prasinococcus_capsulatus_cf.AAC.6
MNALDSRSELSARAPQGRHPGIVHIRWCSFWLRCSFMYTTVMWVSHADPTVYLANWYALSLSCGSAAVP